MGIGEGLVSFFRGLWVGFDVEWQRMRKGRRGIDMILETFLGDVEEGVVFGMRVFLKIFFEIRLE